MYTVTNGFCTICGTAYYGYHDCPQINKTVPYNNQFTDRDLLIKIMAQLDDIEQKLNNVLREKDPIK